MSDTLLQFVHISDTHILAPGQNLDYGDIPEEWQHYANQILALPYTASESAQALVRAVNALAARVDFVLHTGDIAAMPCSPGDYRTLAKTFEADLNYPIYYVPGNHDDSQSVREALTGRAGDGMFDYTFERGGVQLVCLDTTQSDIPHAGQLSEAQLNWLVDICSADNQLPLVIAMHHHPLPMGVPYMDALILQNGDRLHQVLLTARHRLRGVFFGHIHTALDMMKDGITYSSTASSWMQLMTAPDTNRPAVDEQAPFSFNLVTIAADHTLVRRCTYRI